MRGSEVQCPGCGANQTDENGACHWCKTVYRAPKIPDVSIPIETFEVPDRGDVAAKPVRAYVDGDIMIEEFEIVVGPRQGQTLTLKTKMRS